MKELIKKILLQSTSLETQSKIVQLFLQNLINKTHHSNQLQKLLIALEEYQIKTEDKFRKVESQKIKLPERLNFQKTSCLEPFVIQNNAPWLLLNIKQNSIPGMISHEEKQYYSYIGQFYSGQGEIIELGPWLGLSTHYIIDGLIKNPNFTSKKIYVFDDFIWRSSWMNKWLSLDEQLENHQDFQFLFNKYSSDLQEYIQVDKRKIVEFDGNQNVPQLNWDNSLIEFMYIDCGRTFEVNQAWYKIYSPYFIPNVTLLIMQDWRTHREFPPLWYNQTKQFTESKSEQLQLIHEVSNGCVATFLYKG
ncbi:MAG: hypothetical protein ACREPR_14510 [Brasilonema sp.]